MTTENTSKKNNKTKKKHQDVPSFMKALNVGRNLD